MGESSDEAVLDAIADEFLKRRSAGERLEAEEFISRRPDLADRIRSLVETLCFVHSAAGGHAPPAHSPKPGMRLGDYLLLREIGRGGMGVVYEAEQVPLNRRVALKLLSAKATTPTARQRFLVEARAAARLHHTNIVPVFDTGEAEGSAWYAMQLIPGVGLDIAVARCSRHALVAGGHALLPATASILDGESSGVVAFADHLKRCAEWARQAAEALDFAHRHGVVHRDVKPSNLLLDEAGAVWVADFGLAKTDDSDLTNAGELVGTLRYLAPERFHGQATPLVDVYGLGACLYELTSLQRLFESNDRARSLQMVQHEEPPKLRSLRPEIPLDLETIVHKAIAKDPKRRYRSARELADDLRRFLDDEPIHARPPRLYEEALRFCRRRPAAAALIGVLLVATLGSIVAANLFRKETLRAEGAERSARLREADAYVAQANGISQSGRPGQRFQALEAVRKAAAIGRELGQPPEWFDALRHEAASALVLPHVETAAFAPDDPDDAARFAASPDLNYLLRFDRSLDCTIHSRRDGREVGRIPRFPNGTVTMCQFIADDLLIRKVDREDVWDLWKVDESAGGCRLICRRHGGLYGFDVNPQGTLVATHCVSGVCEVVGVDDGATRWKLAPTELKLHTSIRFHPRLPLLAAASYFYPTVELRDYTTGAITATITPKRDDPSVELLTGGICWSSDGARLLVAAEGRVLEYDCAGDGRSLRHLRSFRNESSGTILNLSPDGGSVAASGWGHGLRIFDQNGRRLFQANEPFNFLPLWRGDAIVVSSMVLARQPVAFHVSVGRELRHLPSMEPTSRPWWIARKAVAAASGDHLLLIQLNTLKAVDRESLRSIAECPIEGVSTVAAGTKELVVKATSGTWRWPIRRSGDGHPTYVIGPPALTRLPGFTGKIGISRDGRTIATILRPGYGEDYKAGLWVHEPSMIRPRRLGVAVHGDSFAVSPEGGSVVYSDTKGPTRIHDMKSRVDRVRSEAFQLRSFTAYSRSGGRIFSSIDGGAYFDGNLKRIGGLGDGTFIDEAPDGGVAAMAAREGVVRIVDVASARTLVSFRRPDREVAEGEFTSNGEALLLDGSDSARLVDLRLLDRGLDELGLALRPPKSNPPRPSLPEIKFVGLERLHPVERARRRFWQDVLEPVRNPLDAEAFACAGARCSSDGCHLAAILLYEASSLLDGRNWEFQVERALAWAAAGRPDRAATILAALSKAHPEVRRIQIAEFAVAVQRSSMSDVLGVVARIGAVRDGYFGMLLDVVAHLLERGGRRAEALAARRESESVAADPGFMEALKSVEMLAYESPPLPAAYSLAIADAGLRRRPDSADLHLARCWALRRLGRFEDCLKESNSPHLRDSNDATLPAMFLRAAAMARLGLPGAADELARARARRFQHVDDPAAQAWSYDLDAAAAQAIDESNKRRPATAR